MTDPIDIEIDMIADARAFLQNAKRDSAALRARLKIEGTANMDTPAMTVQLMELLEFCAVVGDLCRPSYE